VDRGREAASGFAAGVRAVTPASPRRAWAASAAVGLGFLMLYGATLTAVHRFDAVSYVLAATHPSPAAWFNPHHLLYVWLIRAVGRLVGFEHVVVAMQALSALAASGALAICTAALARVIRPGHPAWAVLGAALLGVSASFWISAVETDPYALTLLSVVGASACWLRATERPGGSAAWHAAAGIVVAAGTLVHQMLVLFAVAHLAAVAVAAPRRLAAAIAFVAPLGIVTGSVYLAVGVGHGFFHDPRTLLAWLTTYAHQGYWGPAGRPKLREGLYGFLYSVAPGAAGFVPTAVVGAVALILGVAGLWLGLRYLRGIGEDPTRRAAAALALGGLAVFVPFILWYAAFYAPHWQFVTLFLVMLLVPALADVARGRSVVLGGLAAACVVLGTMNYVRVIAPLTVTANDVEGAFARAALARMPAGARLVAPIGIATALMLEGLGAAAVFVVPHRAPDGQPSVPTLERLRAFIEAARRDDRSLWVFGSLVEPEPANYLADDVFTRGVSELLRPLARDGRITVLDTAGLRGAVRTY
jgi:hypothetical protein